MPGGLDCPGSKPPRCSLCSPAGGVLGHPEAPGRGPQEETAFQAEGHVCRVQWQTGGAFGQRARLDQPWGREDGVRKGVRGTTGKLGSGHLFARSDAACA